MAEATVGYVWPRLPGRGSRLSTQGVETASAVLSDLAAGASQAEVARRLGLSPTHVSRVARAAGAPRTASGSARANAAALRELRTDADAAGLGLAEYLREARADRVALERIVALLHDPADRTPLAVAQALHVAIGRNAPELAEQVRGEL